MKCGVLMFSVWNTGEAAWELEQGNQNENVYYGGWLTRIDGKPNGSCLYVIIFGSVVNQIIPKPFNNLNAFNRLRNCGSKRSARIAKKGIIQSFLADKKEG